MSSSLSEASIAYWETNQVSSFHSDVTAEVSLAAMNARNAIYPGLLELMPVAGFEGKMVIDFGCGPGHDTIGFLLHGVERVYALDTSTVGLSSLRARLRAHGFEDRCTLLHPSELAFVPKVDHIHAAGVIHHLAAPVVALKSLGKKLKPKAEIRMMVYAAESDFVKNQGGPEAFERVADGEAPIAKAWTRGEVRTMAEQAGLEATYLGGYWMAESSGPGLGGCWSLR